MLAKEVCSVPGSKGTKGRAARSEKEENKRENPEDARALTGETEGGIKVEQTTRCRSRKGQP